MRFYRVTTTTKRQGAPKFAKRVEFVGDEELEGLLTERARNTDDLVKVLVETVSQAAFIRATRPNE